MPKHKCPFPACEYETTDVSDELAAVLLTVHSKGLHLTPPAQASQNSAARVEKVRRPTITSAGVVCECAWHADVHGLKRLCASRDTALHDTCAWGRKMKHSALNFEFPNL